MWKTKQQQLKRVRHALEFDNSKSPIEGAFTHTIKGWGNDHLISNFADSIFWPTFSRKPSVNQRKIKTTERCSLTKRKATCETENRPKIRRNTVMLSGKDHDGNANENITWQLINLGYLNNFVIIPTRSTCKMWLNDPATELVGTMSNLRKGTKKFSVVRPQDLEFNPQCCFAEDDKENVPKSLTYEQTDCSCSWDLLFCGVLLTASLCSWQFRWGLMARGRAAKRRSKTQEDEGSNLLHRPIFYAVRFRGLAAGHQTSTKPPATQIICCHHRRLWKQDQTKATGRLLILQLIFYLLYHHPTQEHQHTGVVRLVY